MKHVAFALSILALAACKDETVSGYDPTGGEWRLESINGVAFSATATLSFPKEGVVSGRGPCNAFSANQTVPYPWFKASAILSTKRACPDLAAERAYFHALSNMTLAEFSGDVLILSNDAGQELVFKAQQPDG